MDEQSRRKQELRARLVSNRNCNCAFMKGRTIEWTVELLSSPSSSSMLCYSEAYLFGLHREKRYINVYVRYNTILYGAVVVTTPGLVLILSRLCVLCRSEVLLIVPLQYLSSFV